MMLIVGKHSGPAPAHPGRGRRVRLTLGALATFVAWVVLVYLAIQIGGQVRTGNARAWVLLVIATIGAVCCLFLALQLAGKVLADRTAAQAAPSAPSHPAGGRRIRH